MKPKKRKHSIPFLSDIPRKNNFETPSYYFESVENSVFTEIALEKIHNNDNELFKLPDQYFDSIEASVISKLQSELLYKESPKNDSVPAGYFENFEDSLLKKLPKQGKVLRLKTLIKSKFTPIAIAASLLLIFTLGNVNNANAVTFENISSTDIESWVENGDLVFSIEDFTEQVTDTTLELKSFSNIYSDEQALDFLENTALENILFND